MMLARFTVLLLLLLCGCRWQRSELLVVVDSDLEWGSGRLVSSLVITVRTGGPTGAVRLDAHRVDLDRANRARALPLSFEVHPIGDDPDRVAWIEVKGCGDDGCTTSAPIAVSRLTTRFAPGAVRTVRMTLDARCEGIMCRDGAQTCSPREQLCVSSDDGVGGRGALGDAGADAPDAASPQLVAAGGGTSCVVRADGTTRCAGGLASSSAALAFRAEGRTRSEWTDLLGFEHVSRLAIGDGHACALHDDGRVSCRGRNEWGQLGDGSTVARDDGVSVTGLHDVDSISGGLDHSCALEHDGSVWCWGRVIDPDASPTVERRIAQGLPVRVEGVVDAVEIASGDEFDCARQRDHTVVCWGIDINGQLGDGGSRSHADARAVLDLTNAVGLAAGARHACARLRDGSVRCWGEGSDGQRGDGRHDGSSMITTVLGVSDVARLAAGSGHTCARDSVGRVSCWGRNERGQLGDGTARSSETPHSVDAPGVVVDLVAGREHTCLRTMDGLVACTGSDAAGQLGSGRDVASNTVVAISDVQSTSVAAGDGLSCVLASDGVRCAGVSRMGTVSRRSSVLHDGPRETTSRPTPIEGLPAAPIALSTGYLFTCALLADGGVRCWGENARGQLGDGTSIRRATPAGVVGITDAAQVCTGKEFACARSRDGVVHCWGSDEFGQLATAGSTSQCNGVGCNSAPVRIGPLPPAEEITCGYSHACARAHDGSVRCWGSNASRETGSSSLAIRRTPVLVAAIPPARALTAGDGFTCAIGDDDNVWCWGDNGSAQTGMPTGEYCGTRECSGPRRIAFSQPMHILEIASGVKHVCVRTADDVYCWGQDEVGQLGHSSRVGCDFGIPCDARPVRMAFPNASATHPTSIGLAAWTTCVATDTGETYCSGSAGNGVIPIDAPLALTAPTSIPRLASATNLGGRGNTMCGRVDGVLSCWGDNYSGQLANGIDGNSHVASRVPVSDVTDACVGGAHACALRGDGSVWCFGINNYSQLGSGPDDPPRNAVPQHVTTESATAIACGNNFTCVIAGADAQVECWGANFFGQLGTGAVTTSAQALVVPGTSGSRSLAVGGAFVCALDDAGHVACWGSNAWGQCGQPASDHVSSASPVRMADGALLEHVVGIAAVIDQTVCAWRDDGSVWCWGLDRWGALGRGRTGAATPTPVRAQLDPDVESVRGGYETFCAHHRDGHNTCWGDNRTAELGLGFAGPEVGPAVVRTPDLDLVTPAGGNGFTCGRRRDGTGVCWGANFMGALGDGSLVDHYEPRPIVGLERITDFVGGLNHECAIVEGGSLFCWGEGASGQTGDPLALSSTQPAPVRGLDETTSLAVGFGFVCGLNRDGAVACAGTNDEGQLGDGTRFESRTAQHVDGVEHAMQISAGVAHACAVLDDRTHSATCWGRAESGQLGVDGHIGSRPFALGVAIDQLVEIAAGGRHTCALRTDGSVWCWGANDRFQLGATAGAAGLTECPRYGIDGLPTSDAFACAVAPRRVEGLANARHIAAGGLHTCAWLADDTVRCWGANTFGQLGDGTTADSAAPVSPAGITGVVAMTASRRVACRADLPYAIDCDASGEDHTCVVLADHTMRCWGRNDRGQLGEGTGAHVDRHAPVAVIVTTGVTDVRAGGAQTCVQRVDRSIACFGDDTEGQLGAESIVFETRWRALSP